MDTYDHSRRFVVFVHGLKIGRHIKTGWLKPALPWTQLWQQIFQSIKTYRHDRQSVNITTGKEMSFFTEDEVRIIESAIKNRDKNATIQVFELFERPDAKAPHE